MNTTPRSLTPAYDAQVLASGFDPAGQTKQVVGWFETKQPPAPAIDLSQPLPVIGAPGVYLTSTL